MSSHAPIHVLVITPVPHHHRHHHWGSAVRNSNWHGELTATGLDATERRKAALAFAHGQTQTSLALCPSILHPSIRQLSRAARPPPHCAPTAFPPQQQSNPRPPVGIDAIDATTTPYPALAPPLSKQLQPSASSLPPPPSAPATKPTVRPLSTTIDHHDHLPTGPLSPSTRCQPLVHTT